VFSTLRFGGKKKLFPFVTNFFFGKEIRKEIETSLFTVGEKCEHTKKNERTKIKKIKKIQAWKKKIKNLEDKPDFFDLHQPIIRLSAQSFRYKKNEERKKLYVVYQRTFTLFLCLFFCL
jgi:hypothetical protein